MEGYNSGPRPLPWSLQNPLVEQVLVEDDEVFPSSSFVWPVDPDERTMIPFWLSLNEYNILSSTIDVGSDIAFAEDALRVVWLWMRNWRIQVPICAAVDDCIENNPTTITTIINKLMVNPTFNTYITEQITNVSPPAGGNLYPARPTAATPDPLCNAASYVVSKIRILIVQIYDDLETLTAQEVFEAILGIFGWRSGPLYQLIGLLETADRTALLAAYDAAAPDLVCQLIEDELDQTAILAWVATTYPSPSVLGDALSRGIESAADDGKYAQWIAVGATMTGADCSGCVEPPPDPSCEGGTLINWKTGEHGWLSYGATYHEDEGWGVGTPTNRIWITMEYTPRPTSARLWISHGGYGLLIYNEQSGVGIGPLVGVFVFEEEDEIGFRYYAATIEAYSYRTFIEVQSGGSIPEDVRLIQACFDPDA